MKKFIFIVLILVFGTMGLDARFVSYPVPHGLTPVWKNKEVEFNGIMTMMDYYTSDQQADQLYKQFDQMLKSSGWTFHSHLQEINVNMYTKEEAFLYLTVMPRETLYSSVYVCKAPQKLVVCMSPEDEQWLYGDMRGNDSNQIPRYPGSSRKLSILSTDELFLIYQTEDLPEKVSHFYKQRLKASGWRVVSEFTNPGGMLQDKEFANVKVNTLILQKDAETLNILITHTEKMGTTLINITKNMKNIFF